MQFESCRWNVGGDTKMCKSDPRWPSIWTNLKSEGHQCRLGRACGLHIGPGCAPHPASSRVKLKLPALATVNNKTSWNFLSLFIISIVTYRFIVHIISQIGCHVASSEDQGATRRGSAGRGGKND